MSRSNLTMGNDTQFISIHEYNKYFTYLISEFVEHKTFISNTPSLLIYQQVFGIPILLRFYLCLLALYNSLSFQRNK